MLPVILAVIIGVFYLDTAKFSTIVPLLLVAVVAIIALIFTDKSLTPGDIQRVLVIFIVSFFVVFFWAAFEQAPASLTFFADEQMNRNLFGFTLPASLFQNLNAIFVVVGAPIMAVIWTALGRRNAEPPSPLKMAFGLAFLALGYLVMCFGVHNLQPGVKVSMFFLVALYFLHSVG